MQRDDRPPGRLIEISGAVVRAKIDVPVELGEVVRVGRAQLLGEVIALERTITTVQVYEETAGLTPGDPLYATGAPLEVELGPGLLGAVFDGIQRPLESLARESGDFLDRGTRAPALDRERLWPFEPRVRVGEEIGPGTVFGTVPETSVIEHRLMVPPETGGRVLHVAPPGPRRVEETALRLRTEEGSELEVSLIQRWNVRVRRPGAAPGRARVPFITGQRVLDTFFPLTRGGAAGLPGGFGTGKTVLQHSLCKWAHADIIVFVGCGERGNEMTRILRELPELVDPRNGQPLADRTILIANTSNMPVSAREASIYTGVTLAEYYRDMGYHVALLADSTSRWAEALREISGRLEEMPAEEGYPPYLASRLATFYERAGTVTTLGGAQGSVTTISAISPAGGDLTEPVTRHTQRFARCFWSLEKERAEARIFPAVSIRDSYSDVSDEIRRWWEEEVDPEWPTLRQRALELLGEADRIESTARLIGAESLPERQRFLLRFAALLEEGFLRQAAFDPIDSYCSPKKQVRLLRLLLRFHDHALRAIDRGASAHGVASIPHLAALERAKSSIRDDEMGRFDVLEQEIEQACDAVATEPDAVTV